MNSWFSNSWLLRGLRRTPKAINTDDEDEYSYPREKQAKTVVKEETPFSGAMTSAAGSWVLCQDRAGQRYWWNEVTGQWTYQLYNNTQQSYMYPQQNLMYPQQQQYGMASSPQYMVQQPWLGSPSRESQGMLAGGAAAAWGWQQGGGYENEEDEEDEDEEEEEEEDVKGVWGKYYTYRNGRRQSLWIHSATGIRTTVDPTA